MDPASSHGSSRVNLAGLLGRVELLVAHLAGPALRRRIGVEDLVQDVMVELLRSERAAELSPEELWPYACAVARTTVIDAARRLRHAPHRISSLAPDTRSTAGGSTAPGLANQRSSGGPGPRTLAATSEENVRLRAAFDDLSPEYRRVLGLRRFEGLSARETAQRMGRTESAVHSLFRRALLAWSDGSVIEEKK